MTMRTYSELKTLKTFDERYNYLRLGGRVGLDTFSHERWLNQTFYRSREWKLIRTRVIARDLGCDLGIEGRDIVKQVHVHHMNPMRPENLYDFDPDVLDPEFLISVSFDTHNAIHYGEDPPPPLAFAERKPNDTKLW